MKKRNKVYAIYNKEDELLFIGDLHDCCDFLNISSNAFFKRLNRKNKGIYIIEEESSENILANWVYMNLKKLGMCVISIKKIDRYGKENIIRELKGKDFENIIVSEEKEYAIVKAEFRKE